MSVNPVRDARRVAGRPPSATGSPSQLPYELVAHRQDPRLFVQDLGFCLWPLRAGNLTRDPDLRYTAAGTAVANLRLAVNRTFVVQGDKREETLFIDVVAWAKQAEACAEYLAKGSAILVDGRLQSREYEAKDGGKRTVVEVVADTVQFLTRRPGAPTAAGAGAEVPVETAAGADDDVPF